MIDITNADIGARLKKARIKAGVSLPALGARLGVSFQAVAKYEKGTSAISALRLIDVARALGIDACSLLPKPRRGAKARPSRGRDREAGGELIMGAIIWTIYCLQGGLVMHCIPAEFTSTGECQEWLDSAVKAGTVVLGPGTRAYCWPKDYAGRPAE